MGEAGVFEPGTRVELINGMIVEQDVRGQRHSIPPEERTASAWEYRWTRTEYDRLIAAGVFPPDTHAELLYGTVYAMSPQGSRHSVTLRAVEDVLRGVFQEGFDVRTQLPFAEPGGAEPEPDVAVVKGHFTDYAERHPSEAVLLVEIAVTSYITDRDFKLPLYAMAGVPEFWIVNVNAARVEVYRGPDGYVYRDVTMLEVGGTLTPLAAPNAAIPIADLLP